MPNCVNLSFPDALLPQSLLPWCLAPSLLWCLTFSVLVPWCLIPSVLATLKPSTPQSLPWGKVPYSLHPWDQTPLILASLHAAQLSALRAQLPHILASLMCPTPLLFLPLACSWCYFFMCEGLMGLLSAWGETLWRPRLGWLPNPKLKFRLQIFIRTLKYFPQRPLAQTKNLFAWTYAVGQCANISHYKIIAILLDQRHGLAIPMYLTFTLFFKGIVPPADYLIWFLRPSKKLFFSRLCPFKVSRVYRPHCQNTMSSMPIA